MFKILNFKIYQYNYGFDKWGLLCYLLNICNHL